MTDLEKFEEKVGDYKFGITPMLYSVAHKCMTVQNEKLREFNISIPQAIVLGIIEFLGDGTLNQKTLSNKMGVKQSSVSSMLKTMIKNELITKEQSKTDGRNYILKVTDKGNKIIESIMINADKMEEELYGSLTSEEKENLKAILKKLE